MALKKRILRRWRKNVHRLATDVREEILNKDDDGTIWPDKGDWGYAVNFTFMGHSVSSCDDSWYGAFQGANTCIKWILFKEAGQKKKSKWYQG